MAPSLSLFCGARRLAGGCNAAFLVLAIGACATTRGRPTVPTAEAAVVGSYTGQFVFDSERFRSTLQLRSSGPGRIVGAFRVSRPIEIEGVASGVVIDDLLRITVTWRSPDGCDGTIEGILSITGRGDQIEGPVAVSDCGEPVAGRMSFRRTDRSPGIGSGWDAPDNVS